ncbi:MAG: hypothetical protein LIP09_14255 [Bacteroidales bacterium]|nr:hypothetical protein [Bacteroidales bacterium]MCC8119891.1 hypothetical protein [Bacteroidales bacterium]
MAVENPRHPHDCKITRRHWQGQFEQGVEEIVYEGKCRVYGNRSIRVFTYQGVEKADMAISLPLGHKFLQRGDIIEAWDKDGKTLLYPTAIVDATQNNLGTTAFVSTVHN